MAKLRERAKFGYLNYSDIQTRIEEGKLNQYDVVYCKDKKNQYLIDGDLNLIELRSRIYIYSSEEEAIDELNKNTDTYVGQLVSILPCSFVRFVSNGNLYSNFLSLYKASSFSKISDLYALLIGRIYSIMADWE